MTTMQKEINSKIEEKVKKIEELATNNEVRKAIAEYEKLLDEYPDYEDGYLRLVDLLIIQDEEDETEDIEKAIEYLDKLLSFTENKEVVQYKKCKILFSSGMIGRAEKETSKLVAKYPNNPNYYKLYADILARMRKFERAIHYYEKALAKGYELKAEIYSQLANIYYTLEDYDKAISYFNEVIKFQPDNPINYYHLALAYEKKGDLEKVVECADKALEKRKDNTEMLELKAKALIDMKKYDEAIYVLRKWRDADPDSATDSYLMEADIYRKQRLYNRALETYDKILKTYTSPFVLEEKAEILSLMGRNEEALKILEHAYNYNSSSIVLLKKLINLYMNSKKYDQALKFLNGIGYSHREDPEILYKKVHILTKLHRLEEALEILEKIQHDYEDDASYWFMRGFILNALKRTEEAQKCIDKGLSIEETKPKLWYYKALFYASMRDKEQTIENLRMAFSVAPYLKKEAKEEELFDFLRKDKEFQELF